ncbi:hypothetical protein K432DRAFT_401500 [Lepidopterella palustris CBS 459.81]|uniref:Zn(2)-C6 fungal-type domain-containing protein n=1 Tax=Lepidopterella palustris CBS 459.81 TaxID=1314670 RepID=A0A8E2EHR3_9PEZI|nr:hypothetical protein K432DRAFT_401500 [Lepidopterella palustris CBS 459.81]
MVLDTPLLRVSRPVAACSRCRAAKVKCDGKLPACTACEKSNRAAECSSTNDQFARGKERSYVATLEARVEKLEKKLIEARARRKSSVAMPDYDSAGTPRRTSVDTLKAPRPISKRAARRKEAIDIDDLVSDFGLLAVNATARDFYGFTSAMSYARLIISACAKEALPSGMTKLLPPRYAATPLIQHYLNNIFVLLPIFDEASFYASVDAVYHADSTKATDFDHWTVRMVLALACLSLSDQRGDTHYSDAVGHVNAALEHAEEVLHPGFISSIQALVLLVEYAMMDPHHFDSWTLIGAASRAMVDLGIHQDPSKSASVSRAKLELRRRVYHCVYALDRSISLVQTRAFSFSDDSAHVALPFSSNPLSPSKTSPKTHVWLQSFDAALDLFRIRKIQSIWYMDLFQSGRDAWVDPYPYIWRTYSDMTSWFQNMPSTALPSTKAFFELELLYSYVYILSPSPRIPRINEYAQRLIFEHCIAYATNLLALISKPSNTTKPPLTFHDAMRAYMTGRQFVDVLARNQDLILDPIPPTPPPPSVSKNNASEDPLAPAPEVPAPLFPAPLPNADGSPPADPTNRAIGAIDDFTTILSRFGMRFGYINWRDRFQRESAALLAQLYHRAAISPLPSPQHHAVQPHHQHRQHQHQLNQQHQGLTQQQLTQQQQSLWAPVGSLPQILPPQPSTTSPQSMYTSSPPSYSHTSSPPSYPPSQQTSPFHPTSTPPYPPTYSQPEMGMHQPVVDWGHPPPPQASQGQVRNEYMFPPLPGSVPGGVGAAGMGNVGVAVREAELGGGLRQEMEGGGAIGVGVGGGGGGQGVSSEIATTGWETLPGGSLNDRFM